MASTIRRVVLVVILVALAPLHAQQSADRVKALNGQIDRIFSARVYEAPRFGPARWLPDGMAYAIVEPGPGGYEIAR
jgi:hypothetical protein